VVTPSKKSQRLGVSGVFIPTAVVDTHMDDTPADVDDPSDESLTELVNYLTPRRDNEMIATYQNTTAIACPVCEKPFDYLIASKDAESSLSLDEVMDLCVSVSDDDRAFLFTHE
jgi:hypothetical protein